MEPAWQVPDFTALELKPKARDYCVCVFVLNENGRIRSQLEKMRPLADHVDTIVADGGSTDGSLDNDGFLRDCGVSALLTKTGPGRLSAQMRMALAFALDRGYKGCVVVDGNDKDDTSAVPAFVERLRAGFDHVQGSRYVPSGQGLNTPWVRQWGVRLIHAPLISLASGRRHTDTTNGFRAYSRKLLTDPRVQPFREVFSRYELHYYLTIRASRLGFRTCEVPVSRRYPGGGAAVPSKISGWRGNWLIATTLLAASLGLYDPNTSV